MVPDDKYSHRYMQIFWQQLQTTLSQKGIIYVDFLLHFWNVHEIWNILQKKKSILAELLPKLLHPKEMFT